MIADALQRGCRRIVMGIGGSATNDAGIGLLAALGYRFLDERGEELEVEDILPYSLEADTIVLEDEDYGIWYLDIQEHPERYTGKTVVFRAQAMTSMKLPKGTFIPGRNAMTCCAEDIRFFGFLCKYDRSRSLKKGEWVMVAARIQWLVFRRATRPMP